jgi:tRNA (cmo5U34)-methyltransferase
MIGLLARRYVQPDTRVYDLGCSLGAASLAMQQSVKAQGVEFVAVDNSVDMIERCRKHLDENSVRFETRLIPEDICSTDISNASMTVLNLTLQFINPDQRMSLLQGIAKGTNPGGVLLLSEKIGFQEPYEQGLQSTWHHDFKRAQGYSDLEISAKRNALEQVMKPDTEKQHLQRFRQAGWSNPVRFFQAFNFVSYLAFR